jgi:hypothetical protein
MLASIPSPSFNGIHVGPVDVRIYGLTYVLGLIAAVVITTHRWEREGGSRELVQGVALWAFRLGSPAAGATSWPRAGTSPHAIAAERHDVGAAVAGDVSEESRVLADPPPLVVAEATQRPDRRPELPSALLSATHTSSSPNPSIVTHSTKAAAAPDRLKRQPATTAALSLSGRTRQSAPEPRRLPPRDEREAWPTLSREPSYARSGVSAVAPASDGGTATAAPPLPRVGQSCSPAVADIIGARRACTVAMISSVSMPCR